MSLMGLVACSGEKPQGEDTCCTKKADMEVVLNIERRLLPEQVSAFRASFEKCKEGTLSKEKGCLLYTMYQSYTDTCVFFIAERWVNKDAHKLHMTFDHFKEHAASVKGFGDKNYKTQFSEIYVCPKENAKAK